MHDWGPLIGPLDPGVRVEAVQPNQVTIRHICYNFDFISYPSIWVTMPPLGNGAQVHWIRIWGPKRWPAPTILRGAQQLLFFKVFAKMHGWGSRGTPDPLYSPCTRRVMSARLTSPPPKNLPALEDHLLAKFLQNPSSSLDFYWEQTPIQTHTLKQTLPFI